MTCPHCGSTAITEHSDRTALGYRRFRCRGCSRSFNERTGTLFNRPQYPKDVVCLMVFWRFRYQLSLRDLAEMFLQRGIILTHEAVREWEAKLVPPLVKRYASDARARWGKAGMSMRPMCVFKTNGSISTGPLIGMAISWMFG